MSETHSSVRQHPILLTVIANTKLFLVISMASVHTVEASRMFYLVPAVLLLLLLGMLSWRYHPWECVRCCSVAIGAWSFGCAIMAEEVPLGAEPPTQLLCPCRPLPLNGSQERCNLVFWACWLLYRSTCCVWSASGWHVAPKVVQSCARG